MKLNKLLFFILISLLVISYSGCSGGGGGGGSTSTPTVTLASIAVTPANPGIAWGGTQQFTATGTYSDSTTQDITTSVTWSSSNTDVATISNTSGSNGLATSFTAGATDVSASLGSVVSPSTTLTVNSSNINNVITVTVNGGIGIPNVNVPNWPYVSVMVCTPGTTNCITIPYILLDTGSYGLRIFRSFLATVPLTQVTSGSGSLTECIQYVGGSADWGPVQTADVILGNETAANVPIQVIDSTFGQPTLCSQTNQYILDTSPSEAGYNGILGVGPFTQDCGSGDGCGWYYSCNGSSCTPATTVSLNNQVSNPVSFLSTDNNGVILRFPIIPLGGVLSVNGDLVLGIDTQSNNSSSGVTMYPADPIYGYITTIFNGNTYSDSCYIDSGSNGLFFPAKDAPTLPTCGDWFCPSSTQKFSATIEGYTGSPSNSVSFQIGDADTLLSQSTSNEVFIELGGPYPSAFDWGFPFFLGRSVYVGIEGKTSSLGTGPYWAF